MTIKRREFINHLGLALGSVASCALPKVSFAQAPVPGKLVFILLRGGFDGLAALVPIDDPAYASIRGELALDSSELIKLADGFALTPGLGALKEFWDDDELIALHAMAIPYRTRSHFDGQAVLETGLDRPSGSADGWLNRLITQLSNNTSGVAIAAGMPRSLSGTAQVSTWSPTTLGVVEDAYLDRLHLLYREDSALQGRFEAALSQMELGSEMDSMGNGRGQQRRNNNFSALFQATAQLMTSDGGANIAAMEFSGWDTHANQGIVGGPLDRRLAQLADGLLTLKLAMSDQWEGTTVVVMTEFGRTARPNGSRGTDHGTAGAGFILGNTIARSKIVTDWPGLSERQLFEGRDLAPTMDTRSVLKGVLAGTFDLTAVQQDRVFPDSQNIRALSDLLA